MSCLDLGGWRANLLHLAQGFQGPESTCVFSWLPGAEGSEKGGVGSPGGLPQGLWGGVGSAGPTGLPSRVGGNAQNFNPFGPLAAQLLASLCCHLSLVLLSGDATWCHLPAPLQWLFWACLPKAWVV